MKLSTVPQKRSLFRLLFGAVLVLIAVSPAGAAGTAEEADPLTTDSLFLAVGTVVLEAADLSGPRTEGILLTFRSENGREVSTVTKGPDGLFAVGFTPGRWSLVYLGYEERKDNRVVRILLDTDRGFSGNPGTVVNLGGLRWYSRRGGEKSLVTEGRFRRVENLYRESRPDGPGTGSPWIRINPS